MKRFLASISIILLISTAFISGCFRFDRIEVFADSIPSGFTQVDNEADQVEAFKYYCKSRNLAIEGSVLDAVTQVTTKAYQTAVDAVSSEIGFDMNSLQNELYKRNTSSGQEFFYTASGINAMNRIFSEFLQNNNLAVGDQVSDQNLYNGYIYGDNLVYIVKNNVNPSTIRGLSTSSPLYADVILQEGKLIDNYESYLFTPTSIDQNFTGSKSYSLMNQTYTVNYTCSVNQLYHSNNALSPIVSSNSGSPSDYIYRNNDPNGSNVYKMGADFGICFFEYDSSLRFCILYRGISGRFANRVSFGTLSSLDSSQKQSANVYITTNNTTINNNNYEGDTIIKNTGQTQKPSPPIPDPNDDHNSTTEPINPSDPDSDSNLTFPLIDLDIPSIDWSLGDLSDKFPFSIPFDLIAFFTVLNAEPETPELQGQIDLGIVTWDIDWNLSDFDNIAKILRNLEFIGFCIGLILITRSLIKG